MKKEIKNNFEEWILDRWKEIGVVTLEDALERASDNAMDEAYEQGWEDCLKYLKSKVNEIDNLIEVVRKSENTFGVQSNIVPRGKKAALPGGINILDIKE